MATSARIASLDIALKGNTQNLDAGLDRAGAGLTRFKGKVNQQCAQLDGRLSNLGSGISGAFEGALTNPVSSLKSALSSLGNAILHPFSTLKSAAVGLISTFKSIGESITGPIKSAMVKVASIIKSALNPQELMSGLSSMASGASSFLSSFVSMTVATGGLNIAIGAIVVAATAGIAALAGLAAAGLYLASQQAPIMASMHRTADTLNMSTAAFSAYASVAGMDAEQFGTGMEHLERTLSEAALSGGATAQSLARVGLNARDLAQMLPEQQLEALADAMQRTTNSADRLALSQELVGRGAGPEFVRMLQNGSAGLEAFRERAERFGLSFTESQGETVKRSNKAWGEWSLGLQGIGRTLAVAFAPAWEYLGTILGNFFDTSR